MIVYEKNAVDNCYFANGGANIVEKRPHNLVLDIISDASNQHVHD